jgi:hypothetical protein
MSRPARPSLRGSVAGPQPPWGEGRRRVGRAAATWLALALASIVTLGSLVVWHLIRRGRLIREGLGPPRIVDRLDPERPVPEHAPGTIE